MTTSLSAFIGADKNKVYFFSGNQYIHFDKRKGLAVDGYPKPIAGHWSKLAFDRIDAVVNWGNGTAYFFSGSQYISYDLKKDQARDGYPKPIKGNWPGITFESIDAVANWGHDIAYFFKGDEYIRYDMKKGQVLPGYPKPIKGHWQGMNFDSVDAVLNWGDGYAYFFKGDQFFRYNIKKDCAEDAPLPFALPWPAVPFESVDAVATWDNGKTYFFKGRDYSALDTVTEWGYTGYPAKIKGNWSGMTFDTVDSVVNWGNGKAYFFKGDRYIAYDIAKDSAYPGYPLKIKGNWSGLTFNSVDAVVNWGNGKAYFFKGDEYIRYDIAKDSADPGYPLKIKGNWLGVDFKSLDAVVNWGDGNAYFFKGGEYIRYLVQEDRAADGRRPINAMTWPGLAWGTKQYDWMGSIPGIEGRTLSELTLPATHDSGAYDFIAEISPVNDLPNRLVKLMKFIHGVKAKPIWNTFIGLVRDMSRAHNRSVGEQLAYGIRSLDLRVCSYKGELHTFHGLVGPSVQDILGQIKDFLTTARREVVLVTASHMSNLSTRDHQKFLALIKETLGDYLYPYDSTKSPGALTVGEIVSGPSGATSRVIFFYDSPGPDKKRPEEVILLRPPVPWVWPYKGIYSKYANESNLATMGADQQQKLSDNPGNPQQLFELNWTLTPQTPDIVGEAVARYRALSLKYPLFIATIQSILAILGKSYKRPSWHSLEELSRQANATLRDFVTRHAEKKINSLNVDFFEDGGAVELAIEMSQRACAQQAVAAAATAPTLPAAKELREPIRV